MKILVSGCSFTQAKSWPHLLFGPRNYEVINVGKSATGNEYIFNSIMYNIDCSPDFVFVLWSGISRSELRVPRSKYFAGKNSQHSDKGWTRRNIGQSIYYCSGAGGIYNRGLELAYNNIKDPSWPVVENTDDWVGLPDTIKQECIEKKIHLFYEAGQKKIDQFASNYFMTQNLCDDNLYYSEKTFQNLVNCQNLLHRLQIPYRFSFIYDIFVDHSPYNAFSSLGKAQKEKYYKLVDWNNYIDLPPFDYALRHDLLSEDHFHLTKQGLEQWAGEIKKILQQDSRLQKFF